MIADIDDLYNVYTFFYFAYNNYQDTIIEEISQYITSGQVKNTYNYQVNEYKERQLEEDIILNNILHLSIKIWQNETKTRDISDVKLEYIIDKRCKIKLKNTQPIKKIENINYIIDTREDDRTKPNKKEILEILKINNLDNNQKDIENYILLSKKYDILTYSFYFIVTVFNATLNTYSSRSKIITVKLIILQKN